MAESSPARGIERQIDEIYRREGRKVFATLIRLLGNDFDLAEDALQDAFTAALRQWPQAGMPANPSAWLVSVGRFKAVDRLRRVRHIDDSRSVEQLIDTLCDESESDLMDLPAGLEDDRLRLIFTCCHPGLSEEARVALTLREVCGLTTEEIAAACLIPTPTLAQRIVRAKHKIRDAGIPYEVPEPGELPVRLGSVLQVIYLVFNEGYSASSGPRLIREELCGEAIRLARLVLELLPDAEVMGLLALMLLQEARTPARISAEGNLVPLEDQDRSLWRWQQIAEGCVMVERSLGVPGVGYFRLQAAIAAIHGEARIAAETDWLQIVGLYNAMMRHFPSPVVELNRAVAIAMVEGPAVGLQLIIAIQERGELGEFHLAYAARAELHRRLGELDLARHYYLQAHARADQQVERTFLEFRLTQLSCKN